MCDGIRPEFVAQHAVADRHAGKPVEVHLHTRLEQLRKSRDDGGQPGVVDQARLRVRLLPRLLVFTLRQRDFSDDQRFLFIVLLGVLKERLVDPLCALLRRVRKIKSVFGKVKAVRFEKRVDNGVARSFPQDGLAAAAAGKMVELQMHDLLGDVKALVLLRVIAHQAIVVDHAAAVVRGRAETVGLAELQQRNALAPFRPAIRQLLTDPLYIHHLTAIPHPLRIRIRRALYRLDCLTLSII